MKLSKTSQRLVDAVIRAAKDPKADLKFFKGELEKYLLKLEKSVSASSVADFYNKQKTAKMKRASNRQGQELEEANLVILSRGGKKK